MRTVRFTRPPPAGSTLRGSSTMNVVPLGLTLDADRTAVRLHDLMGDVEPEPEALLRPRTALLETFEDAGAPLRRDPRAVIAEGEPSAPRVSLDRQLDEGTRGITDRVLEEVRHDLIQPERIPRAGDRLGGVHGHRTTGGVGGAA